MPDWTDGRVYAPLLDVERAGFAWEWLRRHPRFRQEALDAIARASPLAGLEGGRAQAWHLHRFEDPRIHAPDARPVWIASAHPWVVNAVAVRSDEDPFALNQCERFAKLIDESGTQRLLLSDGFHSIRLDVSGAPLAGSPVRLSFELSGLRGLERPLLVLRRLRSLALRGRLAASLHPPVPQAGRQVALLRAFDALQDGAGQADIASLILSSSLERRRWRVHSPSLRSRAQRLARGARRMAEGGFWRLLE